MPETVGVCGNLAIFSWCAQISWERVNKGQAGVNTEINDPSVVFQMCKCFTLTWCVILYVKLMVLNWIIFWKM